MSNKPSRYLPSPRLLLALVFSLLLHVILLSGVNLELPDFMSEHDRIDVALVPLAKPKPVEKPPAPPRPVKPQPPRPVRPKPVAKPVPPPQEAPKQQEEPVAAQPPQPAPPPEPPPEAAATPAPEVEESLAARGFRHVEIEYRVFRGKGGSIGVAKHEYRVGGEGTYSITGTAEASGLVSLFIRGKYAQHSEGMVGPRGLVPSNFSYQRGDNPAKSQKASFDWQAGMLTLEYGQQRETVPLLEGAQDQLSFMYQFMFVPPLEQMQLAITNGKRFRTYAYHFDGEETLKTDIGDVRTLRISKHDSDGEGKLELWLAPDYRYLPVKISQTEKDGTVTEQLVKQLKAE